MVLNLCKKMVWKAFLGLPILENNSSNKSFQVLEMLETLLKITITWILYFPEVI